MSDNHVEVEKQRDVESGATRHSALLLLNVLLLGLLAVVTFGGASAGAHVNTDADGQQRARGDYTMVGGRVPGFDGSAAVYIVDAINQEMMVVGYSRSTGRLEGIGYRNLAQDAIGVSRGRQQPR